MAYGCMALLNAWRALLLGIIYLALQVFLPTIAKHGLGKEHTGMTFLGIGLGMLGVCRFGIGYSRRKRLRSTAHPPPETWLYVDQFGGILVPIGLFWLAFTTHMSVPWIVPIIVSPTRRRRALSSLPPRSRTSSPLTAPSPPPP